MKINLAALKIGLTAEPIEVKPPVNLPKAIVYAEIKFGPEAPTF